MIKTAIILASKFSQFTGLPSVWKESDWQSVERDGKEYKKIVSFDRYFHEGEDANNPLNFALINQFDGYFETEAEYNAWINSTDIVPILHVVEDISNCPYDPTVTRKAELSRLPITDFLKNVTSMEWRIKHYRDGVYIPVEIPDIDIAFQATTDIQREFPAGSGIFKTEYELMIDMQNAGYKVWEIAISELHYNDSKGLLDEKCNYGH